MSRNQTMIWFQLGMFRDANTTIIFSKRRSKHPSRFKGTLFLYQIDTVRSA